MEYLSDGIQPDHFRAIGESVGDLIMDHLQGTNKPSSRVQELGGREDELRGGGTRITLPWSVRPRARVAACCTSSLQSSHTHTSSFPHKSLLIRPHRRGKRSHVMTLSRQLLAFSLSANMWNTKSYIQQTLHVNTLFSLSAHMWNKSYM